MTPDEQEDICASLDTAIEAIGAAVDCATQAGAPQYRLIAALFAAILARDVFSKRRDE